jgi:hypothetical protein
MLIVILGDRRNRRGRLMKLLMPGPYLRRQGRRSTNKARIQAREALAQRIVEKCSVMLVALADLEVDIRSLWKEFERLPTGETILGCTTKKEFCEKKLGRTPRAVRYMLDGGNPNNGGEIISPAKAGTLAEATAEIVVPAEVAEAVEYIPPPASAKSEAKNGNSQTVLLRQLFDKMKSVKLVRLAPSTFNSGVPSASGRYDLELNGLTLAQVKKIAKL